METAVKSIRRPWSGTVLLCLLLAVSCGKNSLEKYEASLERYRRGDRDALVDMEKNLVRSLSEERLSGQNTRCEEGMLFRVTQRHLEILYPAAVSVDLEDADMYRVRYMDKDSILLCGGPVCRVYDGRGKETAVILGEKGKGDIIAAASQGSLVYFYQGGRIRIHDLATGRTEAFGSDTFAPPYDKFYSGRMIVAGKRLCLVLGAAGSYHISIIDLEGGKALAKNIPTASSKLCMDERYLFYVTGSSGAWTLTRRAVSEGKAETLLVMKDLTDMEIVPGGAVMEGKEGLSVTDFSGRVVTVPFSYRLKGAADGKALLEYRGDIYVVNTTALFEKAARLRDAAPELFEEKK